MSDRQSSPTRRLGGGSARYDRGRTGERLIPAEWERRTGLRLRFVYRRAGPSLLVAESRIDSRGRAKASRSKTGRGVATLPIFLLAPQVKLPKRLDLARDAERAHDAAPGLIVANWLDRELQAVVPRARPV